MNIVGSGTSSTKVPSIISEEQGKSVFSSLDTGTNSETGDLVSGGLKGMLTGSSYDPYEQQSQEKLARAAQNLRTSVGTSYANKMNQGSANKALNQADQNIFSSIADTNLNLATEKQAMKERGITAALDVAKTEQAKKLSDLETGMKADAAYGYTDAQGNQVRGTNVLAGQQVDIAKQQAETAKTLGEAQITLDKQKLEETARQFNVSTDQAQKQFDAMLTKDYAALSSQEKQFLATLGLDQAKFEESKKQYASTLDLQKSQLASQQDIALKNLSLDQAKLTESARQFNVSTEQATQQFKDTLTKDYAQLSLAEKQFLANLGLDQAKFEETKKQFTQNIQLEQDRLASNEKLATAQLGLDTSKLAETARQFNISTQQAADQFTNKLKYDYDSLSQQDKQFMESLGLDERKFLETQKQWKDEFGLKAQVATADLNLREKELAQNASQFNSKLEWDKSQFAQTLTEAERNRIWEATQTDKQLKAQKDIATLQNDTEVWKTSLATQLTRDGWTAEAAQQEANRQSAYTLASLDAATNQAIANGRLSIEEKQLAQQALQFDSQQNWEKSQFAQNLSEADKQRIWTTKERIASEANAATESTLDRILQKEISNAQISVQEKQIAQSALQFKDEMAFKNSELAANLSEADKNRIWQSKERAETQLFQAQQAKIEQAFAEKGYNFAALMSSIEGLPEEQAASVLKQVAVDSGITYVVKDASGNPVSNGKGGYVTAPGLEDLSSIYMAQASGVLKDWSPGSNLTADQADKISKTYETLAKEQPQLFVQDQTIENIQLDDWVGNQWVLKYDAIQWAYKNKDKLYKASNGKIYQVIGTDQPWGRHETGSIVFRDVISGTTVNLSKTAGNGLNSGF